MSETNNGIGEKPKKSLILNAFVEMCKFDCTPITSQALTIIQAVVTSLLDCGDTPKMNLTNSTTLTTG